MPSGKVISQDAVDMIRYMHQFHKLSYSKIGELIGRPKNYIGKVLDKCDKVTGERILLKKGRKMKTTGEMDQFIRDLALANPYIGCDKLAKLYNETAEKHLSKSSIHRRLKVLGINVVKVPTTTPETMEKKPFPKSQTVWRFQPAPEKKKRVNKRKQSQPEKAAVVVEGEFAAAARVDEASAFLKEALDSRAQTALNGGTMFITVFAPGMPPTQVHPTSATHLPHGTITSQLTV